MSFANFALRDARGKRRILPVPQGQVDIVRGVMLQEQSRREQCHAVTEGERRRRFMSGLRTREVVDGCNQCGLAAREHVQAQQQHCSTSER